MYADDIILMNTTLSGIQHLANKCTEYNNSNAICFNSDKNELLVSGHAYHNAHIKMNSYRIKPKDRLKHLGFIWNIKNHKSHIAVIEDENVTGRISKLLVHNPDINQGWYVSVHSNTIASHVQNYSHSNPSIWLRNMQPVKRRS